MRRAHLREDLVQPLQGAVEVYLDPTRSRCHILTVVFRTPALNERHSNSTHLSQLVYSFETMIHALRQQLRELSVVEYLERTTRGYLAHGRRVEPVMVIAITTLHENRRVRQTFGIYFAAYVVKMHALSYVTSCVLYGGISVDVAKLSEAESVAIVRGIREAVHNYRMGVAVEDLADFAVQLVVGYCCPI